MTHNVAKQESINFISLDIIFPRVSGSIVNLGLTIRVVFVILDFTCAKKPSICHYFVIPAKWKGERPMDGVKG